MARKTINIEQDLHERAQDAAWEDGRMKVGLWVREAIEFYLDTDPDKREKFRERLERENGD
ncbi:MAG TPA: hypothetical protein VM537_34420 [Anaerolineae bacterium]|nr:hypothetical protein [Anaerolineae bacterium]